VLNCRVSVASGWRGVGRDLRTPEHAPRTLQASTPLSSQNDDGLGERQLPSGIQSSPQPPLHLTGAWRVGRARARSACNRATRESEAASPSPAATRNDAEPPLVRHGSLRPEPILMLTFLRPNRSHRDLPSLPDSRDNLPLTGSLSGADASRRERKTEDAPIASLVC
jgi:hypothetical protein